MNPSRWRRATRLASEHSLYYPQFITVVVLPFPARCSVRSACALSVRAYNLIKLGLPVVLASMLAGCESPDQGRATSSQTTSTLALSDTGASAAKAGELQPSQKAFPAQFQATFYEVEARAGRADSLNAKALEKDARTAEGLLKALG